MDNSSKDEYERIAEVYDLFKRDDDYKAFYELIKTTFLNSCEFLRPARTIEIGCGTGTFTSLFHTDGFNIIGTDISPNMLAIARKNTLPFLLKKWTSGRNKKRASRLTSALPLMMY